MAIDSVEENTQFQLFSTYNQSSAESPEHSWIALILTVSSTLHKQMFSVKADPINLASILQVGPYDSDVQFMNDVHVCTSTELPEQQSNKLWGVWR